jgi:hypothetical protein
MNNQTCSNCQAFSKLGNECRLKPPTPHLIATNNGVQNITIFPVTKPNNWCLEWKADIENKPYDT